MFHLAFTALLILIITVISAYGGKDPLHPDLDTDVPYEDCGSQYGSLTFLKVTPPCGPERCPVNRGKNSTVEIQWMPRFNSSILRVTFEQVDQNFGFSTILFPERNFCGRRNVSCPIVENQTQYPLVVDTMPKGVPPLNMNLKVRAESDDYKVFLCIIAKLSIV